MAITAEVTDVRVSGGKIRVSFGKHTMEFASVADARAWAFGPFEDTAEIARQMLVAWFFKQSPTGANYQTLLLNRVLTIDPANTLAPVTIAPGI